MELKLFSYLASLLYFIGLIVVQKKSRFLPLFPIQIIISPYFLVLTLTTGWEGSKEKHLILLISLAICFVLSLHRKIVNVWFNKSTLSNAVVLLLIVSYSLYLALIYVVPFENIIIELVPLIEFLLFYVYTYVYIANRESSNGFEKGVFFNLLYSCSCSIAVSACFTLLFPEKLFFTAMAGAEIINKVADFIGPAALLSAISFLIYRYNKRSKFTDLLFLIIFLLALAITLRGMFRTVWMSLVFGVFYIVLSSKARVVMWLGIFLSAVAIATFSFFPEKAHQIVNYINLDTLMNNPRLYQLKLLATRFFEHPWGSGLGATIPFADIDDATAAGPGSYYVEERLYRDNYYLAWFYYAGPVAALGFLVYLYYFAKYMLAAKARVLRNDPASAYYVAIGANLVYFCSLLAAFPATLHYPILALCGVLFGFMTTYLVLGDNLGRSGFDHNCQL